jgi:hypothetical protein
MRFSESILVEVKAIKKDYEEIDFSFEENLYKNRNDFELRSKVNIELQNQLEKITYKYEELKPKVSQVITYAKSELEYEDLYMLRKFLREFERITLFLKHHMNLVNNRAPEYENPDYFYQEKSTLERRLLEENWAEIDKKIEKLNENKNENKSQNSIKDENNKKSPAWLGLIKRVFKA